MTICEYFDQYSCLHLASGITAYFWDMTLTNWIAIHVLFSFLENSKVGLQFTKKYLSHFKPYKMGPDSLKNLIGDTISAIIGWLLAYSLEKYHTISNTSGSGRAKIQDDTLKTKFKKRILNYSIL